MRLDLIMMWIHLIIKQSILNIIIIQLLKGIGVYNGASALSSHTIPGHTFIITR